MEMHNRHMVNLLRVSRRFACVAFLVGAAGSLIEICAQRITILDFSSTVSKPRKHPPKPFPPDKILGGRGGGIISGKLIATLVAMDKTEYRVGDEFSYTLELRTAVPETVKVPTMLNIADLEPDDANTNFQYEAMEIWLGFSKETGKSPLGLPVYSVLAVPLLRLYGSDGMPGTQIELKPGMYIEVRGKTKLERFTDPVERFFHAPGLASTEDLPKGAIDVSALCWRGDKFYYEGNTHYEYVSSFFPEETNWTVYPNKITLLPSDP